MTGPASEGTPGGRRLSGAALHVTGAVAVPLCLAAGLFELSRARSGNQLSWGYVVEWPLIAGYGVYLWIRLARERRGGVVAAPLPAPGAAAPGGDDAGLAAWQAYLAELHAADPPGGPPPRGPGRAAGKDGG